MNTFDVIKFLDKQVNEGLINEYYFSNGEDLWVDLHADDLRDHAFILDNLNNFKVDFTFPLECWRRLAGGDSIKIKIYRYKLKKR